MWRLVLAVSGLIGISIALPSASAERTEIGVAAYSFDLGQVTLGTGRWQENQNRTVAYLKYIDIGRLLYVYRKNHGLPASGPVNGGWDAPDFPFRGHIQGHFLTAYSQVSSPFPSKIDHGYTCTE